MTILDSDKIKELLKEDDKINNNLQVGDSVLYKFYGGNRLRATSIGEGEIIGLYPDNVRVKYLIKDKKTGIKTMLFRDEFKKI